jgi:hypothetical protein
MAVPSPGFCGFCVRPGRAGFSFWVVHGIMLLIFRPVYKRYCRHCPYSHKVTAQSHGAAGRFPKLQLLNLQTRDIPSKFETYNF